MASNIEVEAGLSTGADPNIGDVYGALSGLDVSEQSPITSSGDAIAAVIRDDSIVVRVEGHEGEWSEQSQTAVLRALERMDGIGEAEVTAGGYEKADDADEADEDEDADEAVTDVSEVTGVGPDRTEQLKGAGIETAEQLAAAEPSDLPLSGGVAKKVITAAEEDL